MRKLRLKDVFMPIEDGDRAEMEGQFAEIWNDLLNTAFVNNSFNAMGPFLPYIDTIIEARLELWINVDTVPGLEDWGQKWLDLRLPLRISPAPVTKSELSDALEGACGTALDLNDARVVRKLKTAMLAILQPEVVEDPASDGYSWPNPDLADALLAACGQAISAALPSISKSLGASMETIIQAEIENTQDALKKSSVLATAGLVVGSVATLGLGIIGGHYLWSMVHPKKQIS
ncbi:MAG: hypothetical protein LBI20_04300 [Holosporales bacterium]|nr:hypothetical protein [Holosporales bacterium]